MAERKTVEQLEDEIELNNRFCAERDKSDKSYARKEFEKALIWFVALIVGAVILAIVNGALKK